MNEGSIRKLERMMGNPWNGIKKESNPFKPEFKPSQFIAPKHSWLVEV